jgi:two-component system, chemotaxis family, chemotaxis protein CheY
MNDQPQVIIALVDDDSIFQLTASRMLKVAHPNTNILQFSNGDEALRFLQSNAENSEKLPDIILLDVNMPYVDGWMFLDDYADLKKQLSKNILVYMVSSSIDPADINRAKANPSITDYLIKPISREQFAGLLKDYTLPN